MHAVVISCSAIICSLGYKRAARTLVSLSPPLSLCIGGVDELRHDDGEMSNETQHIDTFD